MREEILQILTGICPDVDFEAEKELIDGGVIDSFAVIQIVTELMEHFDIFIDADDIEPENLNSLDNICELVRAKKEA
ncbi:MAG: phosphopantetheine-binding protein [Bacteroidales bacterium]|nr:phosphopantetheine-binding protein [Bacteroidales bacterium]MCM1416734.1 phosphopantetheine-binding protein [bacterium]MCM1424759.1 phosphopantetheine-binding protein [bacterium]